MKIIGITGPTGAGKSSLSEYMRSRGIPVIDADKLYHSLLVPPSPCLDALRSAFGDGIFTKNGELDRKELANIVFNDEKKLELLNATVLSIVLEKSRALFEEYKAEGKKCAAIDAPTLIESGFYLECDTVISVLCPPEVRIERIISRDRLDKEAAKARVNAQRPDEFYTERSHTVIYNDGDEEAFIFQCKDVTDRLMGEVCL